MRTRYYNGDGIPIIAPRWRIRVAEIDPLTEVAEGIASLDDPTHFATHVQWLARREHFSDAAHWIETQLLPNREKRVANSRLCQTIVEDRFGFRVKLYRFAVDFGLVTEAARGHVQELDLDDLIANADGERAKAVWIVAHLLGILRCGSGLTAADDTSPAKPGFWPTDPSARLALALHWIIRTRHGAALSWHLRAMP
jgi:hypothetical protein